MSVPTITKNPEALTIHVSLELAATPERAWQLWADPRQLERWWGPPGYPGTVVDHELVVGGRVSYFMTSPEGEKYHGYWEVLAVDPPRRLEVKDGFADDSGDPSDSMPASVMVVTLTETGTGRTLMEIESKYPSLEAMEKVISMGVEEGLTAALGQIDAILAEDASS